MADAETPTIVLLRSADGPEDRYVEALAAQGFRAMCVPVLAFRFPNQEALRTRLAGSNQYAGLIVTSPRAVHALEKAHLSEGIQADWMGKSAYAVGPKTASALRALGFDPAGEEAGHADALGSVIAKKENPYLFLCGNRRRDTLPDVLRDARTPFEELVVYETVLRTDLDVPPAQPGDWLAFFSPSGIEAVMQYGVTAEADFRIAAIGPTTAHALRDRGWTVHAVADTPSPEALGTAIRDASNSL
jgi:uroporphyrinogen-III synthase